MSADPIERVCARAGRPFRRIAAFFPITAALMETAAHMRHEMLIAGLYGGNTDEAREARRRHRRYVRAFYRGRPRPELYEEEDP